MTESIADYTSRVSEALDSEGNLRVMPAAFWANTTGLERALIGKQSAAYVFPTLELVEWLKRRIAGRPAIEIASGNGVLAKALAIPATDNHLQADPAITALYGSMDQPCIKYPSHVQKLSAMEAIRAYRPAVVVAAWYTHKYDAARHDAGGSIFADDEMDIIRNCDEYIFIGNTRVHGPKPLWMMSESELGASVQVTHPAWLYSRAFNGTPEFIAVFTNNKGK